MLDREYVLWMEDSARDWGEVLPLSLSLSLLPTDLVTHQLLRPHVQSI